MSPDPLSPHRRAEAGCVCVTKPLRHLPLRNAADANYSTNISQSTAHHPPWEYRNIKKATPCVERHSFSWTQLENLSQLSWYSKIMQHFIPWHGMSIQMSWAEDISFITEKNWRKQEQGMKSGLAVSKLLSLWCRDGNRTMGNKWCVSIRLLQGFLWFLLFDFFFLKE